ncbi:MAG: tyrosine-type recombinase/integrase [Gammaproteobacteria bacterium]|nr:tyrosine-type recombinase/integrase [Gammaproteobacteria bacterium]
MAAGTTEPEGSLAYATRRETGRYLGYRKTATGGYWVARYRDGAKRQHYNALGQSAGEDFDTAKRAADEWFKSVTGTGGVTVKTGTVAHACAAYAANLETEGRTAAAEDARRRFKLLVNETEFGTTRLDRLDRDAVTAWRDALLTEGRGKAAANRHLRTLKAALNEAVRMGYAAHPEAWRSVRAFANADGRRDLFLNAAQRRALLENSTPALADFLAALFYTGARPGELARATVADFDKKVRTITLRTMKGRGGAIRTRSVPLAPDALAVFKRAAKDKLPAAPLFSDANGATWHRVYLSRALREAVQKANKGHKKAKLPPGIVGYTCRHTAISEWLAAGVNPVTVAAIAGTGLGMVEKHYHKFISADVADKLATVKLL